MPRCTRFLEEIKTAREGVLTVEGKTIRADLKTKGMSFNDFVEAADYAVIEDAYKRAARIISPDLATTYSEHLAGKSSKTDDDDDALVEAHTIVASIGLISDIKDDLEAAAEKLSKQWLAQFRIPIKDLSDERQEIYRQIREMSADPLDVDLARPNVWLQATTAREADGREVKLPHFEKHFLCDEEGLFPTNFNSWEEKVVLTELQRPGSISWYRNPSNASQDSLGVTYDDGGNIKIVRPDFIFFLRAPDGKIAIDIVDPHGLQYADALPRLKGLARYAEKHAGVYRRIEVVGELNKRFRAIDLTEASTRAAILASVNARELFESHVAVDYGAE